MSSLVDCNHYYNKIHSIFLEKNPSTISFDLYRLAWVFLKDSAKFQSISMAPKAAPHAGSKGKSDD
jgi:hypothetical protein